MASSDVLLAPELGSALTHGVIRSTDPEIALWSPQPTEQCLDHDTASGGFSAFGNLTTFYEG